MLGEMGGTEEAPKDRKREKLRREGGKEVGRTSGRFPSAPGAAAWKRKGGRGKEQWPIPAGVHTL